MNNYKISIKIISVSSLILYLFLLLQCKNNNDFNEKKIDKTFTSDAISDSQIIKTKPPVIINTSTRPKPKIFNIQKKKGDSYIYTDSYGSSIKVELKPPKVNYLPIVKQSFEKSETEEQYLAGLGFFKNYSSDNGLILDAIANIFCDSKGNIWFGTPGGGLSRFDGKLFTNFTTLNGLKGNNVRYITEDSKGNIIIGSHEAGLLIYNGKYFKNINTSHGLVSNNTRCVFEDKSGSIWIATYGGGVSKYNGKTFTNYTTEQGLASNYVWYIIQDKKGNIWFGTDGGGASCFDGKHFTNYTVKEGLVQNAVWCIEEDKKGNLWFGTFGGGVSRYDGKSFTNFTTDNGLKNDTIWSIKADNEGKIWIGTDGGGVSYFDGKYFTNFITKQGLANNIVQSITNDNNGNLWFATHGGGVSLYEGESFINFISVQNLPLYPIWCIEEDKKGNLWFGSNNGISRYDVKSFTNFNIEQGLAGVTVRCIKEDTKGKLWIGTEENGISCYDGKSFTNFTTKQGLVGSIFRKIYEDKKGNLWFGTDSEGVSYYDGKSFTNFTKDQGLPSNSIWDITEDKTGRLWFATYGGGIFYYDDNSFITFTTKQGLINNDVFCFTEDNYGNLWIGTYGGVSRFDGKTFLNFTNENGLPDNVITQILLYEDKIIFGSNYGLTVLSNFYNPKSVKNKKNNFSAQNNLSNSELKKLNPEFEIYNSSTGYPVKDVNAGQNALFLDSRGIIWAATGSNKTALVRIDYKAIKRNKKEPIVVLQNIKINNENISWYFLQSSSKKKNNNTEADSMAIINEENISFGRTLNKSQRDTILLKFGNIKFNNITKFYPVPQNLELPYKNNNITFEFTAIETARPQLVKYNYMLEGYDENWSSATNKSFANFGNIREGNYTFKLKACSPDGVWSETIVYKFKVKPPWYRTWQMYSVYIFFFIGTLYFIYRRRLAKLIKEKDILEKNVKLRTVQLVQANEEIISQRDQILLSNEEITSQRDLVIHQKEQIEEIYHEISDSINYAKRIQQAVLPSGIIADSILGEHFILFKPKDIVSGDFYWAIKIDKFLIVTLADCTGHGVPGAFMSMLGISFLNEIVRKKEITKASQILDNMRESVIESLKQQGTSDDQKDGMDMAIAVINIYTLEMQYAGANNPIFLITDSSKSLIVLKPDKMPVAFYENMKPFTNNLLQLQKGDTLYFATDGYADQFGGPDKKKFLSKRLKELLENLSREPINKQKEILDYTIEDWQNNYGEKIEQIDDITILGLKIK
jgi:ligand-binding sensor domain-containing protein/serine phosphatase RsbU (regulator of sigma subunit)